MRRPINNFALRSPFDREVWSRGFSTAAPYRASLFLSNHSWLRTLRDPGHGCPRNSIAPRRRAPMPPQRRHKRGYVIMPVNSYAAAYLAYVAYIDDALDTVQA